MRGELPSHEQTTCSGNSRCSSFYLLALIEWNNLGQPETPTRRSSRVISVRRSISRKDDITVGGFISVCSVCSVVKKNGIATQTQNHLPNRIGFLQLVDRIVHEQPRELDPFMDRCRTPVSIPRRWLACDSYRGV